MLDASVFGQAYPAGQTVQLPWPPAEKVPLTHGVSVSCVVSRHM